jgi:L-seryl-tRNA(Ser) seleniumtransferase
MRQSGAELVEVGTTNRTHPKDYRYAITDRTALLLKIHSSNFAVVGFTSEVSTAEMVAIGREHSLPVAVDAGSGTLIDLKQFGIDGETTIQQYLKDGADVVTFSGDKLLGGPQAGIIAGSQPLIDRMKKHPLLRAFRIDKLTLAALEATLRLYRDEDQALAEIPTLRMLTMGQPVITAQARRMLRRLKNLLPSSCKLSICEGTSSPGGGTFPLIQLPTRLIEIQINDLPAHKLEESLRHTTPAVIGRVQRDRFMLDVRTMSDKEIPLVAEAVRQAMEKR